MKDVKGFCQSTSEPPNTKQKRNDRLEAQATYNFSRHLNETHTAECLTQLLRLCAEFDAFASSSSASWSTTSSLRLAWLEAEALHVLLSGHNTGLLRAQVLPEPLRSNRLVGIIETESLVILFGFL